MTRLLLTALLCLAAGQMHADDVPAPPPLGKYAEFPPQKGTYRMVVLRVVDGDTVEAGYIVPVMVRLSNINAPSIYGDEKPLGIRSKKALEGVLTPNRVVQAELQGRGKYGRTLAEIWVEDTAPISVNEWLIGGSYAERYSP